MSKPSPTFLQSLIFAVRGLKHAFAERHVRVEAGIALLVIAAGIYFRITRGEWLVCIVLFGLVMGLEIMNTAIERLVDLVHPAWEERAGKVKDLAAGAVLCASIAAAVAGILIFGKYILALF